MAGSQTKAVAWQAPLVLTYAAGPNAAILTSPNVALFLADADCEIVFAAEIHETLGTNGSAVTLDLVKVADGTAIASGTSLLLTTFDLKATVATRQTRKYSAGTLAADRIIYNGQTLGLKFTGTFTALTGVHVTVVLNRIRRPSW
jgi:hypothetical protein